MNEAQLAVCAKMIVTAMNAGDINKVTEIYTKISATASMADAAKLEAMVAASMG